MFIIQPEQSDEVKALLVAIKRKMGFVPPHFELFAAIDIEKMKNFLEENLFFLEHERINAHLMPYLRLEIAQRECRDYCINFNTAMLERLQYPQLSEKQNAMLSAVLKAMYESKAFGADDIAALEALGFTHKDFFDLLSYATNFMGKSKMIEAYLK